MKKGKDRKVIKMGLGEAVLVICVITIAAVLLVGVIFAALKRHENIENAYGIAEEEDGISSSEEFADEGFQVEGNQYASNTGTVVILTEDGKVYARIGEGLDMWEDAVTEEEEIAERQEIRDNVSKDRLLITDEEIVQVYFPIEVNAARTELAFVKTKSNRYLLIDLAGLNNAGQEFVNRGKNPIIIAEAKDLLGKDVIGIEKTNNAEYVATLEDKTPIMFTVTPTIEKKEVDKTTGSYKAADKIAEECVEAILNGKWEVIARYSEYAYSDEEIAARNKYLKPTTVTKELDETIYTNQEDDIYVYNLNISLEETSKELAGMDIYFQKEDHRFLTVANVAGEWNVTISTTP